jgi:methyl-accepting chemotaxis protein
LPVAIVAIAAISTISAVAVVVPATEPAVAEAVTVAKVVGVGLKAAALVEAALVEEAAAGVEEAAAGVEEAAAGVEEAAAGVEEAAAGVEEAAERISANRGERQSANHEKSCECSLDRWSHVSLSLPPRCLNGVVMR